MRHRVSGRKLGRSDDLRKNLFRNLVGELVLHGRVKTTIAKAKAVKPLIDKLVLGAKETTLSARRELLRTLSKEAVLMLVDAIAPRFKKRNSGFSRIIHLGQRKGDNAEMVILEWVEEINKESITSTTGESEKARDTRGIRATRGTKTIAKTKSKREKAV